MSKLALIFSFLMLMSCHKQNQPEQNEDVTHLKYFGFTLIDTYWDDPTDHTTTTNYIGEVSDFTNLADILVINPSDDISARIAKMNAVQVTSLLHISEIFFERVGDSSPSGAAYGLRADYKTRWHQFISVNNLQPNQGLTPILYIGEEPTWNGISFAELKAATDFIKSTLPTFPLMIIEAYSAIDQLQIPTSVDWIGFDHYTIKDPKSNGEYLNELNNLKSKFSRNDQKLVLIMDAHYIRTLHGDYGGIELDEMQEVANSYYELAKLEPKTVALIGYFWPSGFDNPGSVGARNMPQKVKENYIRIGNEIIRK
jgi:hypothetical protein